MHLSASRPVQFGTDRAELFSLPSGASKMKSYVWPRRVIPDLIRQRRYNYVDVESLQGNRDEDVSEVPLSRDHHCIRIDS